MSGYKKFKTADQKKATFAQLVYMEKLDYQLREMDIPEDLEEEIRENRKDYNDMSRADVSERIDRFKRELEEKLESGEIKLQEVPATDKQISYAKKLQEKTNNFEDDLSNISKTEISEVINKLKYL